MPLERINALLRNESGRINDWFELRWRNLTPPPYFSCDVRHSIHKIGVVDTNLFPGGFNNLCNTFSRETASALDGYLFAHHPGARAIVILGEAHTRNKFYLMNLLRLRDILIRTGRTCRITMPLDPFPQALISIPLDGDRTLLIEKFERRGGTLESGDFRAELVLSNNDFSDGVPPLIAGLDIPVIPSPEKGWRRRRKSRHFARLCGIISEFASDFGFDPWELCPITEVVDGVTADNLEPLARRADEVLERVRERYARYGVRETPTVFIKSDTGTYGLGLITVAGGDEIVALNRRKRSKLFSAKGGGEPDRFLVQEGIPTLDTYSGHPIEPVIYGVGREPVGGFFRIHEEKTPFESLNAPGMSFSCLCLHKLDEPHECYFINCRDKESLVNGAKLVARFASLAAAGEDESTATCVCGL